MPVTFTPSNEGLQTVPYFEDVSEKKGFRGHGTHKNEKALIAEITAAVSNLGGLVVDVQQGKFTDDSGKSRWQSTHLTQRRADYLKAGAICRHCQLIHQVRSPHRAAHADR